MTTPFLKWVGGKRQLLPIIKQYIPKQYNTYYEPFVGAGAVLFELQPKKAVINDLNQELINCYRVIKDNLDELLKEFNRGYIDTEERYYAIRNWDRSYDYSNNFKSWIRAARTIYLNKTDFNGLYRVNKNGYFNAPYGKHGNFKPDVENITEVNQYLINNNIIIYSVDFETAVEDAIEGDFIYIDSPYDTISDTANFTSYTKEGFTKEDQIRLRNCFKKLSERGCYCMASNAGTDFIEELYKDFNIVDIEARRNINCDGNKRGKVSEILIMNY
jgi:DNA adenine methylase